MNSKIQNTVNRQKKELNQTLSGDFIARFVLKSLSKRLEDPLVKVIMGPRRCGKSTLARQAIASRTFAYLNFEDEGIPSDVSGDEVMEALHAAYKNPSIYFFDEIQNMNRWEQFIHRLHREGKNCLITGSNAHLLSSELASALTGRHMAVELLPFSYQEFLASGYEDSLASFDEYLKHGGFPQVVTKQVDGATYLSTLWDSIVLKDVVRRHKIRNVAGLNDIYGLLLNTVASRFNYDSLGRAQGGGISAPTIKKFMSYAREAYLLAELEQFHAAPRKRIKSDRKVYAFDNGFVNAKRIAITKDLGRLLENLVFGELLRRGAKPNMDLFYYVTRTGYEVDFLWRAINHPHQLIQVTWMMEEQKTREREVRALSAAAKELNINQAMILTYEQSETIQEGKLVIQVIPVKEWLLA